jgi:HAD superfamily hydrolase (TIGR01549 family)
MQTSVIFDVFGTLVRIEERRNPYLQLLKYARSQGVSPCAEHLQLLMTRELDWREAAEALGIRAGYVKLHGLDRLLQEELASMTVYDDVQQAIELLQGAHIKIGLCSNLASGYGSAVRALLPGLDAYTFSYEVGAVKPEPLIYYTACCELGVAPKEQLWGDRVVMIGDSIRCDRDGARAAGLAGFHLSRAGRGDFSNLIEFAECVLKS